MTTATSSTNSSIPTELTKGSTAVSKNANSETSDRFLKLLVTQMKNQDPLNPVDNAQVTSQMAQISTVTGIEKLNTSFSSISSSLTNSFAQMQMMQGVSMVGREVVTEGNSLNIADGKGRGGFDLTTAASSVEIDIKNAAGRVVDHVSLKSGKVGQNDFTWTPPASGTSEKYTFSVTAMSGKTALIATPLSKDFVDAVNTKDGNLNLQLRNGSEVAYSKIKSLS
jgi:flagellar basal-body rod modification protein FlgD